MNMLSILMFVTYTIYQKTDTLYKFDLECPDELWEFHKCFSFVPEKINVTDEILNTKYKGVKMNLVKKQKKYKEINTELA